MGEFVNLAGRRFGKWTVMERLPNSGRNTVWRCRCDCGTEAPVESCHLKSGKSTQCRRCRVEGMRGPRGLRKR